VLEVGPAAQFVVLFSKVHLSV